LVGANTVCVPSERTSSKSKVLTNSHKVLKLSVLQASSAYIAR
jgi:hypothetical protein